MVIRPAKKQDLDQIYDLFLELFHAEDKSAKKVAKYLKDMRNRRKDFKSRVKKDLLSDIRKKSTKYLVDDVDGILAGYCLGSYIVTKDAFFKPMKIGYVNAIVVSRKFQGMGIAKSMHKEILKWLKSQGCIAVYLEVFSTNPAIDIYKKWGYKDTVTKMWKKI